ncbi:hypothetical protein GOBAR_DD22840 [Gossypium barbadense]|nr:hypothetical protein GOBAR_DD22840 [Gossypium barbadense]
MDSLMSFADGGTDKMGKPPMTGEISQVAKKSRMREDDAEFDMIGELSAKCVLAVFQVYASKQWSGLWDKGSSWFDDDIELESHLLTFLFEYAHSLRRVWLVL